MCSKECSILSGDYAKRLSCCATVKLIVILVNVIKDFLIAFSTKLPLRLLSQESSTKKLSKKSSLNSLCEVK